MIDFIVMNMKDWNLIHLTQGWRNHLVRVIDWNWREHTMVTETIIVISMPFIVGINCLFNMLF